MRKVVGISLKIKRKWLDAVLDRLAKTTDEADLRAFLDKLLKDELPGKQGRAKTAGIVLRIWSGVPPHRLALRDRAVALLPRIPGQERIWLHWGMTALAYPFFRDTTEIVGRLLSLQDDFTTAQVRDRIITSWGDRATSRDAAQYLLNTLVDWEVLRSTKTKGHFLLARKMTASTPDLELWLLEALLAASAADEIEAQQLLRLPESFPFAISVGVADLRRHEGFNIHRQGLDMDMVALRKTRFERPVKAPEKTKKTRGSSIRPDEPARFGQPAKPSGAKNPVPDDGGPHTVTGQRVSQKDNQQRVSESAAERRGRLQVQEMRLLPDNPFAETAAGCARHFRESNYYACVALAQAVLEALVHHVWKVHSGKKLLQDENFMSILAALRTKAIITEDRKAKLREMWLNRHNFHHLQLFVDEDQQVLVDLARSCLSLLDELTEDFFGYDIQGQRVVPNHSEYWSIKAGAPLLLTSR